MAKHSDSWKASQLEKKRKAHRELRRQRGYNANAYKQKNAERTRGRVSMKTKERYKQRVRKYKEFLIEEKNMPEGYTVEEGHPAPTLKELKEFIRWLSVPEFVPGLFLETGNEISSHDRSDLYHWIEYELVEEEVLSAIKKPKHNFKLRDFERVIIAFWATDDPFFMSRRYRVQFHFITLQFLCTGARVSSFTPTSVDKVGRGLRYKNIELVLFRAVNAPWRIGWRLDQQFVKNNKDPENIMFGTVIWDCDEPIYSGALYLLALALADNTLYGFIFSEKVFKQRIPEGQDEVVLRWNEDAKNRCIVRKVTVAGISEDPLTKEIYTVDFRKIFANASLGAAVEGKYSSAHVAQILTQKSKTVYGNDYLANCSGVDVFNALIGKPADNTHIDYFQGYATEICNTESIDDIKRLKRDYNILKRKIYATIYQQFQSKWVQDQRDWKILTRGRERPDFVEQTAEKQAQYKVMPELDRLADIMSSNVPLLFNEKAVVVRDLYTQCLRDFDVVYRPGEEPVEGRCPVASCGHSLEMLKKPTRSNHIHTCVRQEVSRTMGIPLRQVKYCWECFIFFDRESLEFERHCASHLLSMTSQHYEVMVYRHTTIRAGYCIECMWDDKRAATHRIRAFERSTELRDHLEEHIEQNHASTNELDYRRHLHDVHHYNKSICVRCEKACKKRSSSELDKEFVADSNPLGLQKRPHKLQKKLSSPSRAGTNDLKITFWRPPTTQQKAMSSVSAKTEHRNQESLKDLAFQPVNYCEYTSETSCTSQGGNNTFLSSSDIPELTDTSSVRSSPSAVCSVSCTVPIDPRILEPSTAILSHSDDGSQQPNERILNEQLRSHPSAEQPEFDPPSQVSHEDPTLGDIESQGITAIKSDSMANCRSISPPFPPSKELECGLTSNETPVFEKPSLAIQSSFDMCTIESKIAAGPASTGPLTRAKARKQAGKILQSHTISPSSTRKAKPYSQEEDQLLKRLMRRPTNIQDVMKKFSVHFPGRSTASLQKRWLLIQPPTRRSTRSRTIR
ncbi:hypothetical protein BDV26DRAFT_302608 [Aspergillus bertholletiae]|uniref:Uncharacterized protein n=1 Tax=Aspergillus bertholletiae TaxID=1226010 RepID=A0A5N7BFX8_9EURO|nr:hypothetical protein BDV26DRAFT_302608 [Aspergillus bertholletiae]